MTSIFGSLINYAIARVVMQNCGLSCSYVAVLGDDIDLSFSKHQEVQNLFTEYRSLSFPISE
jgi:hypothetical protein